MYIDPRSTKHDEERQENEARKRRRTARDTRTTLRSRMLKKERAKRTA